MSDIDFNHIESKIRCGINQIRTRGFVVSTSVWGINLDRSRHWRAIPRMDGPTHIWPTGIFILGARANVYNSQQYCVSEATHIPVGALDAFNRGYSNGNPSNVMRMGQFMRVYQLGLDIRGEVSQ